MVCFLLVTIRFILGKSLFIVICVIWVLSVMLRSILEKSFPTAIYVIWAYLVTICFIPKKCFFIVHYTCFSYLVYLASGLEKIQQRRSIISHHKNSFVILKKDSESLYLANFLQIPTIAVKSKPMFFLEMNKKLAQNISKSQQYNYWTLCYTFLKINSFHFHEKVSIWSLFLTKVIHAISLPLFFISLEYVSCVDYLIVAISV